MLNENDVVKLVSRHLSKNGYQILQSLGTNQRGVDIIAEKKDETIYVEAKGETSSVPSSARYGKPFDSKQINTHVSAAVMSSIKILAEKPSGQQTKVAIALPETPGHLKAIKGIHAILKRLQIDIYWVGKDSIRVG